MLSLERYESRQLSCGYSNMLRKEYLLENIGVDTAESEPPKGWGFPNGSCTFHVPGPETPTIIHTPVEFSIA